MIDEVWGTDRKMLVEIVRQLAIEGLDFADCDAAIKKAGVDPDGGMRSVKRLVRNGLVDGKSALDGDWVIGHVTERGLIKAGAWPDDTERVAAQFLAALGEAADREPEPEKRSKLRKAFSAVGDVGTKVAGEALAAYTASVVGG